MSGSRGTLVRIVLTTPNLRRQISWNAVSLDRWSTSHDVAGNVFDTAEAPQDPAEHVWKIPAQQCCQSADLGNGGTFSRDDADHADAVVDAGTNAASARVAGGVRIAVVARRAVGLVRARACAGRTIDAGGGHAALGGEARAAPRRAWVSGRSGVDLLRSLLVPVASVLPR